MKVFVLLLAALLILAQGCFSPTGSALQRAAASGNENEVRTLIEQGSDVNRADALGRTALYFAAGAGHDEVVRQLLAKGAKPSKRALLAKGNFPLHAAAENGHENVVRLLLDAGAKVDVRNQSGQTPLMLAAWQRHPSTLALLLARGASPGAADKQGWTALHGTWDPRPADDDYKQVMHLLIERKPPVNSVTSVPPGITPLINACNAGDPEIVELLLEAGAQVNVHDADGNSPYLIAVRQHNGQIAELLVQHGARASDFGR